MEGGGCNTHCRDLGAEQTAWLRFPAGAPGGQGPRETQQTDVSLRGESADCLHVERPVSGGCVAITLLPPSVRDRDRDRALGLRTKDGGVLVASAS